MARHPYSGRFQVVMQLTFKTILSAIYVVLNTTLYLLVAPQAVVSGGRLNLLLATHSHIKITMDK
jgi:hypothetical protein